MPAKCSQTLPPASFLHLSSEELPKFPSKFGAFIWKRIIVDKLNELLDVSVSNWLGLGLEANSFNSTSVSLPNRTHTSRSSQAPPARTYHQPPQQHNTSAEQAAAAVTNTTASAAWCPRCVAEKFAPKPISRCVTPITSLVSFSWFVFGFVFDRLNRLCHCVCSSGHSTASSASNLLPIKTLFRWCFLKKFQWHTVATLPLSSFSVTTCQWHVTQKSQTQKRFRFQMAVKPLLLFHTHPPQWILEVTGSDSDFNDIIIHLHSNFWMGAKVDCDARSCDMACCCGTTWRRESV